jgi:hypothetical protein
MILFNNMIYKNYFIGMNIADNPLGEDSQGEPHAVV